MTETNALLRLVNATIAYRRGKERVYGRTPMPPELWQEVCAALDALAVTGAQTKIKEMEQTQLYPR